MVSNKHQIIFWKWLKGSLWHIDETLTGATTPEQSGVRSKGNEVVLYISQSSRTGASPSDASRCHTKDTSWLLSYSLHRYFAAPVDREIYIYICVCVCVCVCGQMSTSDLDYFLKTFKMF